MKQLENGFFVAGQIGVDDVVGLAAAGVRTIINNRPDGEVYGQPEGETIRAAANAAGITYVDLPVSQLTGEAVDATQTALEQANGPVLAFCASGTRSTYLWALARSRQGVEAATLTEAAAAIGYDLSPIMRFMR